MSDFQIVEEIKKYAPSATFSFENDRCVSGNFTNTNQIFFGSMRTLSNNDKTHVLKLVNSLKSLKFLNLRKNRLCNMPEMFLPNLEHLDLSSNYLGVVPTWVKNCKLIYLSLGVNNLVVIPDWIGDMENLQVLKLHKNQLTNVESIKSCNKIKFLNLYLNSIKKFPSFIFNFSDIEFFSWGLSDTEEISEDIGNWKNLQYLSLVANRIKYLPDSICDLNNLIGLRVHKNNLQQLPNNIGNLKNLEQITAYCNNLTFLPDSFSNLRLKKCNLVYNNFKEQPNVNSEWLCLNPEDCNWFD